MGQIRGLKIPWAREEDVFLVHHQNSLNGLILNWCIDGCWFTPALNSGVGKYWGFQNSVNQGRQVGGGGYRWGETNSKFVCRASRFTCQALLGMKYEQEIPFLANHHTQSVNCSLIVPQDIVKVRLLKAGS